MKIILNKHYVITLTYRPDQGKKDRHLMTDQDPVWVQGYVLLNNQVIAKANELLYSTSEPRTYYGKHVEAK